MARRSRARAPRRTSAARFQLLFFQDSVRTARELGSRAAVGRRVHEPIQFVKRIDCSSPLLAKALCRNEKDSGTFRFYRPSPGGDGTTEQFFTVEITDGRIDSIQRLSPNAHDPCVVQGPPARDRARRVSHDPLGYEHSGRRVRRQLGQERAERLSNRGTAWSSCETCAPPVDCRRSVGPLAGPKRRPPGQRIAARAPTSDLAVEHDEEMAALQFELQWTMRSARWCTAAATLRPSSAARLYSPEMSATVSGYAPAPPISRCVLRGPDPAEQRP